MDQDQYEFLNDRVDHVDGRVDAMELRVTQLESAKEAKKGRKLELIVIGLILIEIAESFLLFRHG